MLAIEEIRIVIKSAFYQTPRSVFLAYYWIENVISSFGYAVIFGGTLTPLLFLELEIELTIQVEVHEFAISFLIDTSN